MVWQYETGYRLMCLLWNTIWMPNGSVTSSSIAAVTDPLKLVIFYDLIVWMTEMNSICHAYKEFCSVVLRSTVTNQVLFTNTLVDTMYVDLCNNSHNQVFSKETDGTWGENNTISKTLRTCSVYWNLSNKSYNPEKIIWSRYSDKVRVK